MLFLSVCSGIEAASVAWQPLGWNPVAFSEVSAFPCAVLKHHYPDVPNWGDMTHFKEWPNEPIDILIGGTPCQSFSTAGLREGLDDPRGELMFTFGAIAKRYQPRWVVWENVPGVLSTDGWRSFGAFLGMLAECGYGFAYRILDSQYFGLAQRRNRVFVVGYLGDWRPPAAVLFEREALSGNPAPSREAGQEITRPLPSRSNAGGGFGTDFESAGGLVPVVMADGQKNAAVSVDLCTTITAAHDLPLVFQSKASPSRSMSFSGISPTLDVGKRGGVAAVFVEPNRHVAVRQLTPLEWERLMGFQDNYTLVPYPKKLAKDTPRYRAIGNSIAVPVLNWIGRRIQMVEEIKGQQ